MRQLPHDEDEATADIRCRVETADRAGQLRTVGPDPATRAPARSAAAGPAGSALHDLRTGVQSLTMLADLLEAEPQDVGRAVRLLRTLAASNGAAVDALTAATVVDRAVVDRAVESPARAQTAILEGIARRVPLGVSLHSVVEAMEAQLPGSLCSILLVDAESGTLTHGAAPNLPEPYRGFIDGVRIGPSTGSCGTAAYRRQSVVAVDIADDPRWQDFRAVALEHGLRSCWSTPILDADGREVLGTFAVYHDRPWEPADGDIALVGRFTHTAAIAIGTHTLFSRLIESESRFRSAFEGAEVGMALVAPDGRMLELNPALTRMVGGAPIGTRLSDHLDPRDVDEVTRALTACARVGTPVRLAEVRLHPAGSTGPLWTTLNGSLVTGPDGSARHLVLELFDLTERRRVAQARREQAMAEAANQAKTDLLALVSHELRTPLNAVIGFAQVMQLVELEPDRRDGAVEHILTAGRHLLQVINDLLDLTGAETGRLQPDREPFDLRETVAETVDLLADLALRSGLELLWQPPSEACPVLADQRRLRQVLINLVGNAIKFTPAGGTVRIQVDGAGLRISDTGPGIGEDQREHLFTPFHRGGAERGEGSGLGLALSDRLVRAMGGELTLLSPGGTGACFLVTVPPAPAAPVRIPPEATMTEPELTGRVLYVEDDPAAVDLVGVALSCWPGLELVTVPDLAGARRVLAAPEPVDLLLLDLDLPDGSGWELVRAGVRAPTVVVSAGTERAPSGLSVVAQLTKPVMVQELRSTVARVSALRSASSPA